LVGAAIAGSTIWQRRHGRLAGGRPRPASTADPAAATGGPAPDAAGLTPAPAVAPDRAPVAIDPSDEGTASAS
jgi:hypothetical protein